MTQTTPASAAAPALGPDAGAVAAKRRHLRLNSSLLVGLILTITFLVLALLAFVWVPHNPNIPNMKIRLTPPFSPGHWLGTDALGRDVVSQLMAGARTSIVVGAGGAMLSLVAGTMLGIAAAAYGRVTDEVVSRSMDIMIAIPGMVTVLVLAATMGSGVLTTIVGLSAYFIPSFARIIRAAAISVLQEDFITASRLYGRGRLFILARHVIPNITGVMIVQFTLYFAAGILAEAGLSYLGVGVTRPSVSWGMMLNEAQQSVGISSPLALWPGLAIMLVVFGLNLTGDGLRDILDPKMKRRAA